MNVKKSIMIFSFLFLLILIQVDANNQGFKFKFDPVISETEIDTYDSGDAQYINDNFNQLVVIEKIVNIQPPKQCFDPSKCQDDKKDVETWCATMLYGIPDTSFQQSNNFCVDVPTGSDQKVIQQNLVDEGQKIFDNLKIILPPIFLINLSDPLIGMEYDYSIGKWN